MKKFLFTLAGFAAMLMVFTTSCSDSPQSPNDKANPRNFVKKGKLVAAGEIDYNILSRYTTALKEATYTLNKFEHYFQDDWTSGKWERQDQLLLGYLPVIPNEIVIKDGACWESFRPQIEHGYNEYISALFALKQATGKDYNVLMKRNLAINESANEITIGDYTYGLLLADSDHLVIDLTYDYYDGRTGNGGKYLEIASYSLSEPFVVKGEMVVVGSLREAYDWLIESFRERFGESVDVNKYMTSAQLTEPMVYLSDLIAERDYYIGLEENK